MSLLVKAVTPISSTILKFGSLNISRNVFRKSLEKNVFRSVPHQNAVCLHTTVRVQGLSEFFDDEKNWGDQEVKVGRSWKIEELRIKSNEDLHKLWYVLLKEKNMLLTMEHACKEEYRVFPNPERIDKVEESMSNLEQAVRERNRAYWLLETGETGERPCGPATDPLGRKYTPQYTEHFIPVHMNKRTNRPQLHRGAAVVKFTRLLKEKAFLEKKKYYSRVQNHVSKLQRLYPNMDQEAVQKQYPEVDVAKVRRMKRSVGHHLHNEG